MQKKIQDHEVRWGIIGVGNVCEVKSAPAMNLVNHSKVEAVMRRDAVKARDYAKRHSIAKWYNDADDLINDPKVNAIYIATPPNAHLEYTLKAAAAGKPIYVEKPMARTHSECLQMIDVCRENSLPLFVAYYRRTLPHFLKVKELIESGAIGDVRFVEIRMCKPVVPDIVANLQNNWRVDPEIAGGGYFYDLASHQLDFLDFLFGPIKSAFGYSSNQAKAYPAEDIITATFAFESGVLGTGSWCFTSTQASEKDITTIYGSEGEISYVSFGDATISLKTNAMEEQFHFELPKHIQQYLIEQIVDDLLGKGACVSTGSSAARTNQVMQWMAENKV